MSVTRRRLLAAAVAALVGACSTGLKPAPEANEVAGPGRGAVVAGSGVRIIARADAWNGMPAQLYELLTPMLVTVENHGDTPLRIAYRGFRLMSDTGRRYSALPPFRIDGRVDVPVAAPYYGAVGFGYAPYMRPYYSSARIFPFAPDRGYWDRYAPLMVRVNLPTQDMLDKALPEGVLEPGGRITGFLYFEGVGPEVERVRFTATLDDARSGNEAVRLELPFIMS